MNLPVGPGPTPTDYRSSGIPQEKIVIEQFFFKLSLNVWYQCLFRKNLKDRSLLSFWRYDEPNLAHLRLFWHLSCTSCYRFTVHFEVAGSKGVQNNIKKKLDRQKVWSTVAHNCHGKTKSHSTTNFTHGKTKLTHVKTKLTHGKTKKTS